MYRSGVSHAISADDTAVAGAFAESSSPNLHDAARAPSPGRKFDPLTNTTPPPAAGEASGKPAWTLAGT
jgi:hypothetical protein